MSRKGIAKASFRQALLGTPRGTRPHTRLAGAALAFALALTMAPALVGRCTAEAQDCTDCHDDVQISAEPHGDFDCTDCHASVAVPPHPDDVDAKERVSEPCSDCHDVSDSLADSVHDGAACADCHGPAHAIVPAGAARSPVSARGQIETCGTCHEDRLIEQYRSGVHGHALLGAGLPVAASCASCHGAHEIRAADDPKSSTSKQQVPNMCGGCHSYLLETWTTESAHGIGWKNGENGVPVCTTCHHAHGVEQPTLAAARLHFPEDCGHCHEQAYETYRDGFHGQFTSLGFLTAAVCSDCHTPHRNLAADDPRSTVHPDNVVATCGQCHEDATVAFATFDPHSDPSKPTAHPAIHWVWLFMTTLLVCVFGFFAIHDFLWLQRSAVALFRGEIPRAHVPKGPWVKRFRTAEVRLHYVVIVSFLLLAATGLPLRFHERPWAQMLAEMLGGVGATSLLHRWAALATFAYFFIHLSHVGRRLLRGDVRKVFWGPTSLVPQPGDLRDLYRNVRYFLYLGPRPAFDRWTYWEKFDYLAVFWGVVIIGTSGLMLWFPSLFTLFLPGWALNVAFVVHSDEALLAVGFIFVFHFFHTHLRPESFPLDPVIFVDRMPLERFRDERSLEYERALKNDELESLLVDPPTREQLARARAFGFTAMAIGMFLAIAILSTYVAALLGA